VSAWCELQKAAVVDVAPHWLTGLDGTLIPALHRSPLGRRCLAEHVEPGFRLIEEVPLTWGDDSVVRTRPWLLASLHGDGRLVRIAGALRALAWIRRQLERSTVLVLDEVLGSEVYGLLLAIQEDWALPADMIERLDWATPDSAALASLFDELGSNELVGYGELLHPAVEERIRLALGKNVCVNEDSGAVATTAVDTVAASMTWEQAV